VPVIASQGYGEYNPAFEQLSLGEIFDFASNSKKG